MARIRSIKPEIWLSAQVMNLSHGARLLFIGLITQADDEGRGSSDLRKIKGAIFGGDDCTAEQVRMWFEEIVAQRLALTYQADGYGDLYMLPSWAEHQSINKPTKSRYPPPVDKSLPERYRNTPVGSEGSDLIVKDRIGATGARRAPEARVPGAPPEVGKPEVLTDAQRKARADAAADNERQLERAGIGATLKAIQR